MLCPYIEKVETTAPFTVLIQYKTGEKRLFNAENYLTGEIFIPLRDEKLFNQYKISFNTLEWPNGADFAPEFIWEHSTALN